MNKTFKKIFSVCCAVVTTLTATLFHSTNLKACEPQPQIVFAGPKRVGKTKLTSRICGTDYDPDYVPTKCGSYHIMKRITCCDTSGDSKFLNFLQSFLRGATLCVLCISNTKQEPEDFLNILAENDVPKVVLCITKTDENTPDNEQVSSLLTNIQDKLPPNVKVFDEVLYTSANENTFKFCTPDKYTDSDEYRIYNTGKSEPALAEKLYELCVGKAEDFQPETYTAGTSKDKKYALGLGIPAGLLTLIFGTGYYEYDRHFRKKIRNKLKLRPHRPLK